MPFAAKGGGKFGRTGTNAKKGMVIKMGIDYCALGKRIRTLRIDKGMTQDDLRSKIDISKTHMSHIETGTTKASLQTLVNISNALGATIDQLLFDSVSVDTPLLSEEINEIIRDCDKLELRMIIENMISFKKIIRNYKDPSGER